MHDLMRQQRIQISLLNPLHESRRHQQHLPSDPNRHRPPNHPRRPYLRSIATPREAKQSKTPLPRPPRLACQCQWRRLPPHQHRLPQTPPKPPNKIHHHSHIQHQNPSHHRRRKPHQTRAPGNSAPNRGMHPPNPATRKAKHHKTLQPPPNPTQIHQGARRQNRLNHQRTHPNPMHRSWTRAPPQPRRNPSRTKHQRNLP